MRSLPDQIELKKLFDYEPETGLLRWRSRNSKKWDSRYAGKIAGSRTHKGYIQVAIYGKLFFAHRIAYTWMTDEQPKQIDHKDNDGLNNKWVNLREANQSENMMNRKSVTGGVSFRGVYAKKNKFIAQIKKNRKHTYIGLFETAKEAAQAYDLSAVELHEKFAITNKQLGLL